MNDKYQKSQNERRAAHLKDLFADKPYSKEWEAMYIACLFFSPFAQFISAALALGVPAYLCNKLFGSWTIGLIVGGLVIAIFEIAKRNIVAKAAKLYYTSKLSTKLKLSVAAFALGSVAMSTFGTPILVHKFAPVPKAPTESEIVGSMDSAHTKHVAMLTNLQQEAKRTADKIHAQNNWKGVTVTAARANILELEKQAKAAADSISSAAIAHNVARKNALYEAEQEYRILLQNSKSEIENVGWIFAGICLIFEAMFLLAMSWVFNYKYREYCELDTTILSKQETKPTKEEPSQAPSIGFNQEGKILNDSGKLKIICRKANGELKAYDSSQLSTAISNTKGDRQNYFESMKRKLEAQK